MVLKSIRTNETQTRDWGETKRGIAFSEFWGSQILVDEQRNIIFHFQYIQGIIDTDMLEVKKWSSVYPLDTTW